jgi:uncharacterized secreted protein with C-terminal beta-propeller domain
LKTETSFLLTVAVVAIVAAVLLIYSYEVPTDGNGTPPITFKELPRFESYQALKTACDEGGGRYGGILEDVVMGIATGIPMAKSAQEAGVSTDFSTTNIQVEGVDEGDIMKTDGKYIYNFSKNRLIITKAYPIEGSEIVYNEEFQDLYPTEMFVSGDKLLLFGNFYESYNETGIREEMPYYWGGGSVVARLYDISDRTDPELEKELQFEGSYLTSRLIGEHAYFVVNSWPHWNCDTNQEDCIIPLMSEDGVETRVARAEEIGYLPPMPAQNFVTIASINLENGKTKKETIAGNAQNVFASKDSIYLAASVWLPPETLIPDETPVVKDIERIVIGDTEKTVINKFGLVEGKIGYVGQGQVPGHVLNQFSMDEFEGNFRIATTSGQLSRFGSQTSNNLYVLDEEMEVIGKLEDLAPGESIYSARFMGKKAYMVTFKKVDPLFVIDVSDPTNPTVLGKLKIPGYSDYLHPIDETHIIGLGKETIEAAKGAWYQGLKMAIFDVSDVENPIEMHKIVIGDRGTESYALHDHKAFLYDKGKELLVIPIMLAEIPEEEKKPLGEDQQWPSYGEHTFQGAFVFRTTLENGFEEKGRITHVTAEDELKRGYYYGSDYSVKRALYIGNVLYTLSDRMLKANDLENLEELKQFSFE